MIRRALERVSAGILLSLSLPLLAILYIIVRLDSAGPFFFLQLRMGKNKKPFWIYKIRTMIEQSERLKSKFEGLNEVDGPVFKIRNDPRYTRIGRFLSHSALDELPQLINIIKGEMAFVGPRPLPKNEANLVPKKYRERFSVLPGMTSSWIVQGAHMLTFRKWMELDCEYSRDNSPYQDIIILLRTISIVMREIKINVDKM